MNTQIDLLSQYLAFWPTIVAADLAHYLAGAGGIFALVWLLLRRRLAKRKIRSAWPPIRQLWSEFGHSIITVLIFGSVGTGLVLGKLHGLLPIYTEVADYGWLYFAGSLALMVAAHDAYFYWWHRWMHRSRLLWRLHARHHRSHNPSPWAAYAFNPGEALIHASFMPLFAGAVPMHAVALFLFTAHMILRNAAGHSGFELFPRGWVRLPAAALITTVTHHDMHHENGTRNFGLYFTWWDRWMGTEHDDYRERFDSVTMR